MRESRDKTWDLKSSWKFVTPRNSCHMFVALQIAMILYPRNLELVADGGPKRPNKQRDVA